MHTDRVGRRHGRTAPADHPEPITQNQSSYLFLGVLAEQLLHFLVKPRACLVLRLGFTFDLTLSFTLDRFRRLRDRRRDNQLPWTVRVRERVQPP